jgi:hypothetical protein
VLGLLLLLSLHRRLALCRVDRSSRTLCDVVRVVRPIRCVLLLRCGCVEVVMLNTEDEFDQAAEEWTDEWDASEEIGELREGTTDTGRTHGGTKDERTTYAHRQSGHTDARLCALRPCRSCVY